MHNNSFRLIGALKTSSCFWCFLDIHYLIISLRYEECIAEILTIHSSESLADFLLLLVTGIMHRRDFIRRRFVQTFSTFPQDGNFLVLNNIFTYLNNELPAFMFQIPSYGGRNVFCKGSYFVEADILFANQAT